MTYFYIVAAFLVVVASFVAGAVYGRYVATQVKQSAHMVCSECKLLVARFEQKVDGAIQCANCKRKEEIEKGKQAAADFVKKWL